MKWKAATLILFLALLALLLLRFPARHPDLPSVVVQVRQLKQLVTVRYSIQRVVSLTEEKVPIGSESLLLLVQGEALAGVDLAQLTDRDIAFDRAVRNKVLVTLPAAQITDVFLDEKHTRVWDRHITWWTPWVPISPNLETNARLQGISDVRAAALEMGILPQAQRNAQTAVRDLLAAFGFQVQFAGEHT